MRIDFNKQPNTETAKPTVDVDATVVPQPQAPAPVPTPAPAPAQPTPHYGPPAVQTPSPGVPEGYRPAFCFEEEDEMDFSEILLPNLNLVARVGALSVEFEPGAYVLDRTIEIPRPLEIVVFGMGPTRYAERLTNEERAAGAESRLLPDIKLVAQLGGTIDARVAKLTKKPFFQPLKTIMVGITKPEGLEDGGLYFFNDIGKRKLALAFWSVKGTAYPRTVKVFKTHYRFAGKKKAGGYLAQWWKIDSDLAEFNTKNVAIVPVIKPGDPVAPEDQKALYELVFGEVTPTAPQAAEQQ